MYKVLEELQPILNELYAYSGDCDECCMKHFANGLCILYTGGDPCNQSLYADYQSSGISEVEWVKYEEDSSYVPKDTFREDLWEVVYEVYNRLTEEGREQFWNKAYPHGHITDCYWLYLYQK